MQPTSWILPENSNRGFIPRFLAERKDHRTHALFIELTFYQFPNPSCKKRSKSYLNFRTPPKALPFCISTASKMEKKLYGTEHKSSNGSSPCKTFVNKILNRRTAVHELKVIRTSASNFSSLHTLPQFFRSRPGKVFVFSLHQQLAAKTRRIFRGMGTNFSVFFFPNQRIKTILEKSAKADFLNSSTIQKRRERSCNAIQTE